MGLSGPEQAKSGDIFLIFNQTGRSLRQIYAHFHLQTFLPPGAQYNALMHDIPQRLADIILEIEATLRNSGKWDNKQPPVAALSSPEPFCLDTLNLEQWLQWVLLPRMKYILETQKPLPQRSAISEYAEECFVKNDPHMAKLLALIKRFDELITIQAGRNLH